MLLHFVEQADLSPEEIRELEHALKLKKKQTMIPLDRRARRESARSFRL
jgi:hypothetical protein